MRPLRSKSIKEFEQECIDRLKVNEGCELHVYRDSMGIPTIGIGFNLQRADARHQITSVGADFADILLGRQSLSMNQVLALFMSDLATAQAAAASLIGNFRALADPRRFVIIDLVFNMGAGSNGFGGFRETIELVEAGSFQTAASHLASSAWFSQVGNRAKRDVAMMRHGNWVDATGDGTA